MRLQYVCWAGVALLVLASGACQVTGTAQTEVPYRTQQDSARALIIKSRGQSNDRLLERLALTQQRIDALADIEAHHRARQDSAHTSITKGLERGNDRLLERINSIQKRINASAEMQKDLEARYLTQRDSAHASIIKSLDQINNHLLERLNSIQQRISALGDDEDDTSTGATFNLCSLPPCVMLLNLLLLLLAVIYFAGALYNWSRARKKPKCSDELSRAVQAVLSSLALLTTADSILLVAVGTLVGVGGKEISDKLFTQLIFTFPCFVFAIICGLVSATFVLNHVHHKESVAERASVMGFAVGQFAFTIAGALLLSLSTFLF